MQSPYHRFKLSRNPFGELNRSERVENAIVDLQPFLNAIADSKTVVQILGECGNGKSTHLLAIHQAVPASIYVYLPESGPLPQIPVHRPLLVDEAQRLSRRRLNRMLRHGGKLLLGTHVDLEASIRRAGLTSCRIEIARKTDAEHILRVLNQRIYASALTGEQPDILTIEHARWLHLRFGSNIRGIEHFLYDMFQSAAEGWTRWPPSATFVKEKTD